MNTELEFAVWTYKYYTHFPKRSAIKLSLPEQSWK